MHLTLALSSAHVKFDIYIQTGILEQSLAPIMLPWYFLCKVQQTNAQITINYNEHTNRGWPACCKYNVPNTL